MTNEEKKEFYHFAIELRMRYGPSKIISSKWLGTFNVNLN